ncbi:MATE family efflux transporter [Patulibacter americanus]|uniref:MATE family efflux transporter n=1 Tax=Patulibacter americanus TaxID=588672 RepID=UPI0003B303F7|nr:MATE family efflux transporter [Patulibacter americanus]
MPALRSPHDREIFRLALPALGTLAAEPTYLLVDTAMVGHLGTGPLAALALATAVLATIAGLGTVATYATTAAVARLSGAGHDADLRRLAAQSLWLGVAVGAVGATVAAALGPVWISALGGEGRTADDAARYLRIAAPGFALALLSMAAQGWLRGTGDLRTPLLIVVLGNLINLALNPVLIYGAGLGLDGSAIATLIGQLTMGALFVRLLWRGSAAPSDDAVSRRPSLALLRRLGATGAYLLVRSGALLATFAVASAVAARAGEPSLAAHQIGWQLFIFLALVLDAMAIAGQVLIGRALGGGRTDEAVEAAHRMIFWTVAVGVVAAVALLLGRDLIIGAFTDAADVRERARELWPLLCLMLPFAAAVFAFDGILIGAGDARFLALAMTAAALVGIPAMVVFREAGWGVAGVWGGIVVTMTARLVGTWWRFHGRRWAQPGAWRG